MTPRARPVPISRIPEGSTGALFFQAFDRVNELQPAAGVYTSRIIAKLRTVPWPETPVPDPPGYGRIPEPRGSGMGTALNGGTLVHGPWLCTRLPPRCVPGRDGVGDGGSR